MKVVRACGLHQDGLWVSGLENRAAGGTPGPKPSCFPAPSFTCGDAPFVCNTHIAGRRTCAVCLSLRPPPTILRMMCFSPVCAQNPNVPRGKGSHPIDNNNHALELTGGLRAYFKWSILCAVPFLYQKFVETLFVQRKPLHVSLWSEASSFTYL